MALQISKLLIALVLVSLVMVSFSVYFSELNDKYGIPEVSYDNNTFESFNQLSLIRNQTQAIQTRSSESGQKTGTGFDIVGGFFSDAYRVMMITLQSADLVTAMSDSAFEKSDFGAISSTLKVALITILIIAIFLGVIASTLLKRDI